MANNFPFSIFPFQFSINIKAKPKEGSEVVSGANQLGSGTNQLKITAADGKKYKSDVLDYNGIKD